MKMTCPGCGSTNQNDFREVVQPKAKIVFDPGVVRTNVYDITLYCCVLCGCVRATMDEWDFIGNKKQPGDFM